MIRCFKHKTVPQNAHKHTHTKFQVSSSSSVISFISNSMSTQPPPDRRRFDQLFFLALTSFLILGMARLVFDNLKSKGNSIINRLELDSLQSEKNRVVRIPISVSKEVIPDGCNVFEGEWIWDNISTPHYTEQSCPYLVKQTTCKRNGRTDSLYQNWRWKPSTCDLPRFNALKLLEILRNKRLMFVGDSIQRETFESMVCLVQSVLQDGKKSLEKIPPRKIFKAQEYNASIEFNWAPFLVESNSDHATNHTVLRRFVKLDSISNHSKQWEGVDILVFESYVWWMYKPLINATFGSPNNVKEYNVTTAYRLAMETWANWIENSINPTTQKVFFTSMSPTHLWSWEWKAGTDGTCFNETHPIQGPYWGSGSNLDIMGTIKYVMGQLKVNVRLLNITQLSEFRKDGHTSVYGERKGKLLTKEQRLEPKIYGDCIHWCLPGVPDTWNEILYAHLLQDYRTL